MGAEGWDEVGEGPPKEASRVPGGQTRPRGPRFSNPLEKLELSSEPCFTAPAGSGTRSRSRRGRERAGIKG